VLGPSSVSMPLTTSRAVQSGGLATCSYLAQQVSCELVTWSRCGRYRLEVLSRGRGTEVVAGSPAQSRGSIRASRPVRQRRRRVAEQGGVARRDLLGVRPGSGTSRGNPLIDQLRTIGVGNTTMKTGGLRGARCPLVGQAARRSVQTLSAPEAVGHVHPAVTALLVRRFGVLPTVRAQVGTCWYSVVVDGDTGDFTSRTRWRP